MTIRHIAGQHQPVPAPPIDPAIPPPLADAAEEAAAAPGQMELPEAAASAAAPPLEAQVTAEDGTAAPSKPRPQVVDSLPGVGVSMSAACIHAFRQALSAANHCLEATAACIMHVM